MQGKTRVDYWWFNQIYHEPSSAGKRTLKGNMEGDNEESQKHMK